MKHLILKAHTRVSTQTSCKEYVLDISVWVITTTFFVGLFDIWRQMIYIPVKAIIWQRCIFKLFICRSLCSDLQYIPFWSWVCLLSRFLLCLFSVLSVNITCSAQRRIQGGEIGAIAHPQPTKLTSFIMILYNLDNMIKPILIKSFFILEMSHCSRYRAIMWSIVLSQQCCEVYECFILLTVQQRSRYRTWLRNITEIGLPIKLLAGFALAICRTEDA